MDHKHGTFKVVVTHHIDGTQTARTTQVIPYEKIEPILAHYSRETKESRKLDFGEKGFIYSFIMEKRPRREVIVSCFRKFVSS